MADRVRNRVFVSYAREDSKWWAELHKQLAPLIHAEPDAIWWDGYIKSGQKWRGEIEQALISAKVGVLLVSQNFLASEFIHRVELPSLLEATRADGVTILWCLVRACWWERTPLKDYQACPSHNLKAWNSMTEAELDGVLVEIAKAIDSALRAAPSRPPAKPTTRSPRPEKAPVVPAEERGPEPISPPRTSKESPKAGSARRLLEGIDDLGVVDEIGDIFVLRGQWSDAAFTYDKMIDLAAPGRELWMAQGYEKLGNVRSKEGLRERAHECWRFARTLYRRAGRPENAAEVERRLAETPAAAVTE